MPFEWCCRRSCRLSRGVYDLCTACEPFSDLMLVSHNCSHDCKQAAAFGRAQAMQDQLEDEQEGTGPLERDIEKLSAVRPLRPNQ